MRLIQVFEQFQVPLNARLADALFLSSDRFITAITFLWSIFRLPPAFGIAPLPKSPTRYSRAAVGHAFCARISVQIPDRARAHPPIASPYPQKRLVSDRTPVCKTPA